MEFRLKWILADAENPAWPWVASPLRIIALQDPIFIFVLGRSGQEFH